MQCFDRAAALSVMRAHNSRFPTFPAVAVLHRDMTWAVLLDGNSDALREALNNAKEIVRQ